MTFKEFLIVIVAAIPIAAILLWCDEHMLWSKRANELYDKRLSEGRGE